MTSSLRRGLTLASVLVLGVAAGVLSLVPPRPDRAVITVSRFGDDVRLLPHRLAVAPLPLARRVLLERRNGAALLDAQVETPLPGGASLPVRYRIAIEDDGVLPIRAGSIRNLGWDGAWAQWLARQELVRPHEVQSLLAASSLWRAIFPDAPEVPPPALAARLQPLLPGLRLADVEVSSAGADEVVRAFARREVAAAIRPRGRLVLLGLDALDWNLVDELVAKGWMPHTAALLRRGVHAVLEVPRPLISPVVWTTIATGVPPEVHGVLDFLEPDPSGGPPRPVTSASRQATTVWEIIGALGRSTTAIGWWATFPAQAPPGGTVYSDRLTEQLLGLSADVPGMADPPQAAQRAKELLLRASDVTPERLAPFLTVSADELAAALARPDAWDDPVGGLAKLVAASLTVERLTALELERGTEVLFSYLEGTDTVGHLYGPYRPPVLPGFDGPEARRFGPVIDRYYAWVDRWVGSVVASLTANDTLVIVSDHGFTWGDDRPRVPSGAHTATAEMWHRPHGAFLAAGPKIFPSRQRHTMDILDVGPSLLALAGLPTGAEMPGRVPEWLLPAAAQREAWVNYAALVPRNLPTAVELPAQARDEEIAKLRALGYLAGGPTSPQPPAGHGAAPSAPLPAGPVTDRAEARRLSNLAISQASAGDVITAEQTFRKAIAADPSYSSAHYSLAVLLRKQGRLEEADNAFWASVRLGVRERDMAVVRLALDYRDRGMMDKAAEVLAEGRRILPDSAIVWLNSGVFLGELGRFDEAARCLQRATQLDPSKPTAFKNLAAALFNLGNREGARAALTRTVALDPTDDDARRQLAALGGPLER